MLKMNKSREPNLTEKYSSAVRVMTFLKSKQHINNFPRPVMQFTHVNSTIIMKKDTALFFIVHAH